MTKVLRLSDYKCNDYSWEQVDAKADEIVEALIKEKYSSIDIMHIAGKLTFAGNYLNTRAAMRHVIEDNTREGDVWEVKEASHKKRLFGLFGEKK